MFVALTRDLMLSRMLAADAVYDGQFITGVTSTRIYCLPSCRARKPKPHNVQFYATPAEARAAGLRACLRCHPDEFVMGIDARERQFLATLERIQLSEMRTVADLAGHVGVSASTLHELFRRYPRTTPADWLTSRRIQRANALLLSTRETVAAIAYSVGFESLSSFGAQFRRLNAMTPQRLRQMPTRGYFELRLPDNGPMAERQCRLLISAPSGALDVVMTFGPDSVTVQPDAAFPLTNTDWLAVHTASVESLRQSLIKTSPT